MRLQLVLVRGRGTIENMKTEEGKSNVFVGDAFGKTVTFDSCTLKLRNQEHIQH